LPLAVKRLLKKRPQKLPPVPKVPLMPLWKVLKMLQTQLLVPLKVLPMLLPALPVPLLVLPTLLVQLRKVPRMPLLVLLMQLPVLRKTLPLAPSMQLRMPQRRPCNSAERLYCEKGAASFGVRPFFVAGGEKLG
jgi:hypothetical protein